MRKLLWVMIVAVGLWSSYWGVGAYLLGNAANQWFADQAASGMTAQKTGLSLSGFPNRFDLTVEGVTIADPQTGIGWEAPFAQVFAMTWKPWHIITALPPEQIIRLPDQDINVLSQGLRASARARPQTSVPLENISIESGPLSATSTQGWSLGAAAVNFTVAADHSRDAAYRIGLLVTGLAPDPALIAALQGTSGLPPAVDTIHADLTARLSAPLDRNAGETRPTLIGLEVTDVQLDWGTLAIHATGTIEPDAAGYAAGRVMIAVTNWRELVPLLVASGSVTPEVAPTVTNMLNAMAAQGGDPAVLNLPLILQGGRMSLGPLPLGAAPLMVPPTY